MEVRGGKEGGREKEINVKEWTEAEGREEKEGEGKEGRREDVSGERGKEDKMGKRRIMPKSSFHINTRSRVIFQGKLYSGQREEDRRGEGRREWTGEEVREER